MTLTIRPVQPQEYEEAGRVTARAYEAFAPPDDDDWAEYLDRIADVGRRARRTLVLVAEEGGRLVGTLTLEVDDRVEGGHQSDDGPLAPHEVHVRMLGVDPDAQGRGIGRRLMDAALAEARAEGKTLITLNTTRRMRAAQRMYESMGFVRGPDRVYEDGFRLLSYSLEIPPDPS